MDGRVEEIDCKEGGGGRSLRMGGSGWTLVGRVNWAVEAKRGLGGRGSLERGVLVCGRGLLGPS